MSNKNVLITGIAGFIGSKIAISLSQRGYNIYGIDNFRTGYAENIPHDVNFDECDISDAKNLERLPYKDIDVVLHLAAQTSGELSHIHPEYDLLTNGFGTFNILQISKKLGIKKFIYASSMNVYGHNSRNPVKELDVLKPVSYYGISKTTGEYYVQSFSKYFDYTIFRMFNVFGPGQDMKNLSQGMLSIFLAYALENKEILVKGDLNRFRDFIYIDEVVKHWLNCVESSRTDNKIYNLGSGKKTTVEYLINVIQDKTNHSKKVKVVEGTPNDQFGIFADISKLTNDTNLDINTTLENGIDHLVNYLKNQKI